MGYKAIIQLGFIVISFVLIFVYIKPTLLEIKMIQDEEYQYRTAVSNAFAFNQKLEELVRQKDAVSYTNLEALDTYLPTVIDTPQVMADIATVSERSGMTIKSLISNAADDGGLTVAPEFERNVTSTVDEDAARLKTETFTLTVTGTYDSLKDMLRYFESNKYRLEIVDLKFGEFLQDEKTVVTSVDELESEYSLTLQVYGFNR